MIDRSGNITPEVLSARAAITDLLYGYARIVRNGDAAACAEMFTEDAVFEVREAAPGDPAGHQVRHAFRGRTEIQAYLQHGAVSSAKVCPLIHNPLIEINGHEATSNCMMTAWVLPMGQQLLGEYQDRYRFDDRWRFTARVYTIWGRLAVQPQA